MQHAVNDEALDTIFRAARTHRQWQDRPVSTPLLMAIYELMRLGPTESNSSPARIVFIVSKEAKARLDPLMDAGNREKTRTAPATAIIGYDLDFAAQLGKLVPHNPNAAAAWTDPDKTRFAAMRSGSLQAAYFIIAARALGLDCGPMSGFDRDGVAREFFPGTRVEANVLVNIGYGVAEALHPRAPRLSFDEACQIV